MLYSQLTTTLKTIFLHFVIPYSPTNMITFNFLYLCINITYPPWWAIHQRCYVIIAAMLISSTSYHLKNLPSKFCHFFAMFSITPVQNILVDKLSVNTCHVISQWIYLVQDSEVRLRSTTHSKLDLTRVWIHDLQIITVPFMSLRLSLVIRVTQGLKLNVLGHPKCWRNENLPSLAAWTSLHTHYAGPPNHQTNTVTFPQKESVSVWVMCWLMTCVWVRTFSVMYDYVCKSDIKPQIKSIVCQVIADGHFDALGHL